MLLQQYLTDETIGNSLIRPPSSFHILSHILYPFYTLQTMQDLSQLEQEEYYLSSHDEYEIETVDDIQDALRDLLGGTIKSMMEA